jgi:hypothetical protein
VFYANIRCLNASIPKLYKYNGKNPAIVFFGTKLCGMHHNGRKQFKGDESFNLEHEVNNRHD